MQINKKDVPQEKAGGGKCIFEKHCTAMCGAASEKTGCGWEPIRFKYNGFNNIREEMKKEGICDCDIETAIKEIKRLRLGN